MHLQVAVPQELLPPELLPVAFPRGGLSSADLPGCRHHHPQLGFSQAQQRRWVVFGPQAVPLWAGGQRPCRVVRSPVVGGCLGGFSVRVEWLTRCAVLLVAEPLPGPQIGRTRTRSACLRAEETTREIHDYEKVCIVDLPASDDRRARRIFGLYKPVW